VNLTRAEPRLVIASIKRFVSEFIVREERRRRRRSRRVSASLRETSSWTRVGMRRVTRQSLTRSCLLRTESDHCNKIIGGEVELCIADLNLSWT
jgi:hypothetical protein